MHVSQMSKAFWFSFLFLSLFVLFAAGSQAATINGAFEFSAAKYSVGEGAGKVDVTIKRVGGSTGAVTVKWRTNGITAVPPSDYTNVSWSTLSFAAGQTQITRSVTVVDDKLVEAGETFKVTLSSPTGGASVGTVGSAVITIQDNDGVTADATPPTTAITSPVSGATYTSAQTVNIAASAQDNIAVAKVELYDGATLVGSDTTAPYGFAWSITSAGNGTHNFTAKAYDAAGNSQVSAPVSLNVNIPVAVPGSFELSAANYSAAEGAGKVDITIKRVGGSTGAATIQWRTNSVTAVYDQDYTSFSWTTLTFADGQSEMTKSITIVDDKLLETDETFKVSLANPTGGATLGATTSAVVTIQDNDAVTADVTSPTAAITSPASGVTYTGAQTVNVAASAQDNVAVTKVELYDGATLVGSDTTAPYGFALSITAAGNGTHSLTAKAYDAAGNSHVSAAVSVVVSIAQTQAVYTAPVLEWVQATNSDFLLGWSQPSTSYGIPAGGYDIIIDGADTGTTHRTTELSAVISGLAAGEHCFQVEARWTQAVPAQSPRSEQVCATTTAGSTTPPPTTSTPTIPAGPVKAFPGAEGAGANAKGGRGGQIIKVTNLNATGTGSLRAALEASGPRIVVFEVSGQINLGSSKITISNPYITIAGQTAPSPGITVQGGLVVRTHDVVMQHLRVRGGSSGPGDVLQLFGGSSASSSIYNIVVDHCSMSWASTDEVVSTVYYVKDITLSNNIVSETLNFRGLLIGNYTYNATLSKNLMAHNPDRNPRVDWQASSAVVNNLMYNAQGSVLVAGDTGGGTILSLVGNKAIRGPISATGKYFLAVVSDIGPGNKFYVKDNSHPEGEYSSAAGSWIVGTAPVSYSNVSVLPSSQVESYVLANAGARPADRDAVDARVVMDVINRTGKNITSESQVGGFPSLRMNTRTFNPGLNPNGDDDGNGYTNVEEILYQMAIQVQSK